MRIAYISNTRWAHCTEVAVGAALTDLGHDVTFLQEDRVTIDDIERQAFAADLLLYTRTWGNHDPARLHNLWGRLAAAGIPTVSFHLDLYVGLNRQDTIPGDPFWSTAWVFHPDGSPDAHKYLTDLGINHHVLPSGVAAADCFHGEPRTEFLHDVVFVGSALPYGHAQEWPFRDQLVTHLKTRFQERFAHYGPGGRATVRNGLNGPDDRQLNDLYASARVTVGDSIYRPGYVSDRLTESLGRGAILVFPRTEIVDALGYVPYKHYVPYEPGDLDSLDEAVDVALGFGDHEAELTRRDGRTFTAAFHTYTHRMADMLRTVGVES